MTSVVNHLDRSLSIGSDFGDAMVGKIIAHGWIDKRRPGIHSSEPIRYQWRSTLDCATSERILRKTLLDDGCLCVAIMSQAVQS